MKRRSLPSFYLTPTEISNETLCRSMWKVNRINRRKQASLLKWAIEEVAEYGQRMNSIRKIEKRFKDDRGKLRPPRDTPIPRFSWDVFPWHHESIRSSFPLMNNDEWMNNKDNLTLCESPLFHPAWDGMIVSDFFISSYGSSPDSASYVVFLTVPKPNREEI